MPVFHLGIDIAKKTFDVALLRADKTPKHRQFANTEQGFHSLLSWFKGQFVSDLSQLYACIEATAYYGDALARFLVSKDAVVSVVNPATIRAFARTELSRTKTDKADAIRTARFCKMYQPTAWTPPAEQEAVLLALVRRLDTLKNMHTSRNPSGVSDTMESNRREGAAPAVRASVEAVLGILEE